MTLLALLVACAPPELEPFPAPSGPHAIGVVDAVVASPDREEPYTPGLYDRRTLVVRVFYPALPGTGSEQALYAPDIDRVAPILETFVGPIALDALRDLRIAARLDAAPDGDGHPLVLFSHDMGGTRIDATVEAQELASRGYVVACVEHPWDAAASEVPDQGVVYYVTPPVFTDPQRVVIWADDASQVIDAFAKGEGDLERFTGRVDTTRVGYFGHGFGGAAAALARSTDVRVLAGMNWDGAHHGTVLEEGVAGPFAWLSTPKDAYQHRPVVEMSTGPRWRVVVNRAGHFHFTDAPFYAGTSGVAADDMAAFLSAWSVAFFEQGLRGVAQPFLDGPGDGFTPIELEVLE